MSRGKAYRSLDEIMDIFKISLSTVNSIIKKYKIDSFASKWKTQIHAKDFYKVYITHYNPSLFEIWDQKKKIRTIQPKVNNADIFQKLFGSPDKKKVNKVLTSRNLLWLANFR